LLKRAEHVKNGGWSPEGARALELDASDVLSIVEAAYEIDRSPDTWALEVLRATDRALRGGFGAFARVCHEPIKGTFTVDRSSVVSLGTNGETLLAAFEQYANGGSGPWSHSGGHDRAGARCLLTSEIAVHRPPTGCDELVEGGGQDGVNILAMDLDARGFLMSLAAPANRDVSPAARRDLTRVATQILAAIRLRARLVPARDNPSCLRLRGKASLTETERSAVTAAARGYSTKEIAYTFGIAEATVRVLLMRAARRCGVQSRKELLSLWSRSDGQT
jgi:DNA-binding CsgD family transcriptional regulator